MRRGGALDASEQVEGRDAYGPEPRRLSHLWGAYLVLTVIVGVTVALTVAFEENAMVEWFAPNLATEALSVIVTLAFVQRLLEREERARKLRAAVGALRKARVGLTELIDAWGVLIKGSLDPRRTEYPRTIYQLFASYYTEELACLDPALVRHDGAGADAGLIATSVKKLRSARPRLREVLQAYGGTLDSEYLEALDEMVDDPFIDLVTELGDQERMTPEEWRLRINRSRGLLEVHFVRLAHAVRLHNTLAAEAARFRSRHLAPSAGALSLRLGADRDLAIQTEFPGGWWETPPSVGGFRVGPAPLTASR